MKHYEPFIKSVRNIVTNFDYDWLHVIVGPEGVGKTSLGWVLCKKEDPEWEQSKGIVFSNAELMDGVKELKPGTARQMDEGAFMLFNRESMTRPVKKTIKFLTAARQYNMFLVICIPSFWLLDPYVRSHRVRTVSRVVSRGWVWHYSPRSVPRIRLAKGNPPKTIWPKPDFKDSFPDASKLWPEEWAAYLKRKAAIADKEELGEKPAPLFSTPYVCGKCGYEWNYQFGPPRRNRTCPNCRYQRGNPKTIKLTTTTE